MNKEAIMATIGLLMVAQELFHYFPQPWKIHRTKSISGVSPSSTLLIAIMSFVWLGFAIMEQAWAPAVSGVVVVALAWWTVVEVIRNGADWQKLVRVGLAAMTIIVSVVAITITSGMESAGLAALLLGVTMAHGVARLSVGMKAKSLKGVSALYLSLNIADGFLYGTYGALTENLVYVAFAAIQIATSLPVLARWFINERLDITLRAPQLST
jgi:uncharacterized protein with PQ loop repeat